MGKTRLALQAAVELSAAFADGVFFVALAALSDPALVPPTIARALGLSEAGSQPIALRLNAYLQDKQLLLILDNFEHLLPAGPAVAALIAAAPQLTILVTSLVFGNIKDTSTRGIAGSSSL